MYDDPKLEESIVATINENDKEIVKNIDKSLSVAKKIEKPIDKVFKNKKTMPSDGYANPETENKSKFIDNSEITKIVQDESRKIMPAPRVYNGVLPSSSYPGFSKSRINLIN